VPFLPDGEVALTPDGRLPADDLRPGEHVYDAALRIPLEQAGFRMQRLHLVRDGLAWVAGAWYHSPAVALNSVAPSDCALAEVAEALESYRSQTEESYYEDSRQLLERAYLRATTPEGGSGFGRDAEAWRRARSHIVEGIDRSGTFLDVGCANGLLCESIVAWAAEGGLAVEPYGVDFSAALVDVARSRLPQWGDRFFVGNAIDWVHPDGMRFDFVHVLLDLVPAPRRVDLVQHHVSSTVAPGGRLLVSEYAAQSAAPEGTTAGVLRALGFSVAGESFPDDPDRAPAAGCAWIEA
jgi:2-polyprenyl-3-methyl-5-hydroxy-6-metoxy-1,4-benzoquinol methylase